MHFGYLIINGPHCLKKVVTRIGGIGEWEPGTKAILCTARDGVVKTREELEKWRILLLLHDESVLPKTIKEVFTEYFEWGKQQRLIPVPVRQPRAQRVPGGKAGMQPGADLFEKYADNPEWQKVKCEHCLRTLRLSLWRKRHGDNCKLKGKKPELSTPASDGRKMKVYECEKCGVQIKGPSIAQHTANCDGVRIYRG